MWILAYAHKRTKSRHSIHTNTHTYCRASQRGICMGIPGGFVLIISILKTLSMARRWRRMRRLHPPLALEGSQYLRLLRLQVIYRCTYHTWHSSSSPRISSYILIYTNTPNTPTNQFLNLSRSHVSQPITQSIWCCYCDYFAWPAPHFPTSVWRRKILKFSYFICSTPSPPIATLHDD